MFHHKVKQCDTYHPREINTTLPTQWNIIKHKKKAKTKNDAMSHKLFGTIRCGASSSSHNKASEIEMNTKSYASLKNVTKRQKNMTTSRNRYYIDNYNFTDFIVADSEPLQFGTSSIYQSKESWNIEQNKYKIPNITVDDDGEIVDEYSDSNDDGDNMDIDGDGNGMESDDQIGGDIDMEHEQDPGLHYVEIRSIDEENDQKCEKETEEYENSLLTQEEKEQEFHGAVHLMQIRKWQKNTDLLIPEDEFISFVGNVICNDNSYSNDIKFQSSAFQALQAATEEFLVTLFEDGNLGCIHDGRTVINSEDLMFALRIRGETRFRPY